MNSQLQVRSNMPKIKASAPSNMVERIDQALARGGLRQWLQFDDGKQAAEARALLASRRIRHIEALSVEEIGQRHAKAAERVGLLALEQAAPRPPVAERPPPPAGRRRTARSVPSAE